MPARSVASPLKTVSDPRWQCVLARDAAADGLFWYSVATTGVYCRPSCPSRAARAENVTIHATLAEARAAARPCRRCDPDGTAPAVQKAAIVAAACRAIERDERVPALAELAQAAGLSAGYFHRLFKDATGVTPAAYARGRRAARVRAALGTSDSVTTAIYDAGFNASSRFYEAADAVLGMTPTRFKQGGAGETLRFAIGQSTLGAVCVASSGRGVVAILIGDDADALARDLQDRFPRARLIGGDPAYEAEVARAVALVEAPHLGTALPLDIRGTAFQLRVWQALSAIPPGRTATYSEIAAAIGAPTSVRAVAGACAANNVAVAIPCHRVVRRDGALSGYAWGVDRKRALIAREARSLAPE